MADLRCMHVCMYMVYTGHYCGIVGQEAVGYTGGYTGVHICICIHYCWGKVGQDIQGIYRINASLYIIVGGKWGRRLTECRGI